jgi:segregation and condensation protein B
VMRTLLNRGLVEEAGQDTETAAVLYRTTAYFLERIGIGSLEDLPDLAPYLPEMADLDDPDDSSAPASPDPAGGSTGAVPVDQAGDEPGTGA